MRLRRAMLHAIEFQLSELRRWAEVENVLEQRRAALYARISGFPEPSPHQRELEALRTRLSALAPLGTAQALRVLGAPLEQAAEALRRRLPC